MGLTLGGWTNIPASTCEYMVVAGTDLDPGIVGDPMNGGTIPSGSSVTLAWTSRTCGHPTPTATPTITVGGGGVCNVSGISSHKDTCAVLFRAKTVSGAIGDTGFSVYSAQF